MIYIHALCWVESVGVVNKKAVSVTLVGLAKRFKSQLNQFFDSFDRFNFCANK